MTANDIGYHLFDTAFGCCGLAWSSRGLTRLQLPERDRALLGPLLDEQAVEPEPGPASGAVEGSLL